MERLDYDDAALAEHDRAECEAAEREAAHDRAVDQIQAEIERDTAALIAAGGLVGGKLIAGEVIGRRKSRQVQQDAVDAFLDAVLDNPVNLGLLANLLMTETARPLREAFAKTHAAINATAVAEARGL